MNAHRMFLFTLSALCCMLASESRSADPPAPPALRKIPSSYFPEDGPPLALVIRGEAWWLGDFDKDGNFLRDPRCSPNYGGIFAVRFVRAVDCIVTEALVYEHRSERMIKGTMVRKPFGVVVPELGSTILDVKDVDLKKPDRFIWNMPESIPGYVTERKRKYGDNPPPKAQEPPKAGTPFGWEFIPFSKSHPAKPPKYARAIGDVVEFGHLSDEGEFVPDADLPSILRSGLRIPIKYDPFGTPVYYTVPEPPWQRGPKQEGQKESDPEPAYEYRSGRLIKGMLQSTGNFVPELGSKVIDFKGYDPDENRRIYNLPGKLIKAN